MMRTASHMAMAGLIALCFVNFSGPARASPEIVLTTQAWAPYITDESGQPGGLSGNVLKCAFQRMKQPYRVRFLPWKRAQNEVREGRADAFFPASPNQERDGFAMFSAPLVYNTWAWFMRKDNPLLPDSPKFKAEATVTSEAGSNLLFWLEENGYRIATPPDHHWQLASMVLNRHIDAALVTVAVLENQALVEGIDIGPLRRHLIREDPLGVYFSHRFLQSKPDFLPHFNRAVDGCR
ncbi:substrate-binding periplasmic protein [Hwanghaeella sp.]|uniref:substrate-binding periplasmic protein n=1 Tax=Hwanghaeella sp. TaxID=2605943 RepID=UPI003CCBD016